MATQKQIDANRINAQKSTGPRTEEGKSKSRMNAKRDGITGQVVTLSEEDLPSSKSSRPNSSPTSRLKPSWNANWPVPSPGIPGVSTISAPSK